MKHTQITSLILLLIVLSSCNNKKENKSFEQQRQEFKTTLIENSYVSDGETPIPPDSIFKIIKFNSEVGLLDAYISNNVDTTQKHPAVVWAHGGFGGIGTWFWEEDSYIEGLLQSDMVVMCPSWRGENLNPGKFELYYGEVFDLNSAIKYVKNLPYVDTNRIYLAGHSSGGTLTMLTALINTDIRAAFSIGGDPNFYNGKGYGNSPFNDKDKKEIFLRSPINFVDDIKIPIFYFEGKRSSFSAYARKMENIAKSKNKPFKAFILLRGSDHFNIVAPLNKLIYKKIKSDTTKELGINFTKKEMRTLLD